MNNAIIWTQGLSKIYGSGAAATHALRDVTISIPRGSFTAIVGPSGHGKSTLMHLIGGLDRPSEGSVFIDRIDISDMNNRDIARMRSRKIGFVFQFFNLLRNLTAAENIQTAMLFAGIPELEQEARTRKLLELVGLADKAGAKPGQLSGGQQQRIAIARALANDPDILLMDEPTGNLDSHAEAEVLAVMGSLHQQGKTVIIVTHNDAIARTAERTIHITDGQAVSDAA